MYYITFKNKKHPVSGLVFSMFMIPFVVFAIILLGYVAYVAYLSALMLKDQLGINATVCAVVLVLLIGNVTYNGVRKALLPKHVQSIIGICVVAYTIYYQYAVNQWELYEVALLSLPIALGVVRNTWKRFIQNNITAE